MISSAMKPALAAAIVALSVFAGAAFAGSATTDSSGNVLVVDVDVTPPLPRTGAKLEYHAFFGNRNGSALPREAGNEIRLAKGFRLNADDFPTCELPTQPSEVGQDRCSLRAKIGEGTFEADARPALPDPVSGTFEIFNGEPREGNPTLIFLADAQVGEGTVQAELDYEYSGSTLRTLEQPEGSATGLFVLTKVDLALAADRRGKSYIQTPRRCRRSWRFAETIFFEGGGSITAHDRAACVRD